MADTDQIQTPEILAFDYTFMRLLGEGANGKTWLARSKVDGNLVAIKELKTAVMEDIKSLELFQREAATLQSITVPGVPKFYRSVFPTNITESCYLIQEYVPYPSIADLMNQKGKFSEQDTLSILYHLANTLLILQTQYTPPIIHRDIKPSNLLCQIDDSNDIKLALIDFGAVANPQKRSGGSTIAGTFGYMAPEQLQGECSIQSDYYAMGATAVHMLTNVSPYTMPSDVFRLNYKPTLKQEAPQTTNNMIALLDFLLADKASERPKDAQELISAIQNVRRGLGPHELKEKPKKNSGLGKQHLKLTALFANTYSSTSSGAFLTTPDDTWKKEKGIARGYKQTGTGDYYIEFTFKYEGITYVGVDTRANVKISSNARFPLFCTVMFNPVDPHINFIYNFLADQSK